MRQDVNPPAIVREASDLATCKAAAKTAYLATRQAGEDHWNRACQSGERFAALQEAFAREGNHGMAKWMREEGISRRTVNDHVNLYQKRAKCVTVAHLGVRGVLEYLRTGQTGEEEQPEESEDNSAPASADTAELEQKEPIDPNPQPDEKPPVPTRPEQPRPASRIAQEAPSPAEPDEVTDKEEEPVRSEHRPVADVPAKRPGYCECGRAYPASVTASPGAQAAPAPRNPGSPPATRSTNRAAGLIAPPPTLPRDRLCPRCQRMGAPACTECRKRADAYAEKHARNGH